MPIMHGMLGNAAVATVFAFLALAIGRACRSPAWRHFLWVLVLLKLITPPLFHVPMTVLPTSWASLPAEPMRSEFRVPTPAPQQFAFRTGKSERPTEHAPARWEWFWVTKVEQWVLSVWTAGASAWFFLQGRRILRFRRWVARAQDAEPEVAAAARRIARALGIVRPPAVKIGTGIGSPMLWGWGRSTVILCPRELLARLDPEARDTLLAHELAHFLRRDHWVRVLEFLATGCYWWHPAVWLARMEIESAEEECCDAWVVGGLGASPRRYAEALLATIDFVAELRRPCLPPGACPANRSARLLHRRLIRIAHAEKPSTLRGGVAVRAAALAVLVVQPMLRAAVPQFAEPPFAPIYAEAPQSPSTTQRPAPKPAEPPAWANAQAPGGGIVALARDYEVVLRQPDGKVTALGPGKPLALAFAPNHPRLATAGPGPLVRTWDYRGNLLAEASVPAAARGIAYTPDGSSLLLLDAAGGISVRNPYTLAPMSGWSVEGPANSLACAPDSQTVAVAFGSWLDADKGWVEFWSIGERRKLAHYDAPAPVGATRFAPDGTTLVIGSWNGSLTWRSLPVGELVAERQLPKNLVAATVFSSDARTLPLQPPPQPIEPPASIPQMAPELMQRLSRLLGP